VGRGGGGGEGEAVGMEVSAIVAKILQLIEDAKDKY